MGELLNFEKIRTLNSDCIVTDYEELSDRCDEFDLTKKNTDAQTIIATLKQIIRSDSTIVGLSANQVGYNKRILCINFNGDIRTFVNPIIEKVDGIELSREKCHSLPGKEYIRIRNTRINVTYQTPLGKIESVELIGRAAIIMQHHIDHLDGLLLCDVGLEIDENWDKATDEERQQVIDMYLDSLDLRKDELEKEIKEDPDSSKLSDAIRFINSVREGKTKIESFPMTEEQIKVIEEYKQEQSNKKENKE